MYVGVCEGGSNLLRRNPGVVWSSEVLKSPVLWHSVWLWISESSSPEEAHTTQHSHSPTDLHTLYTFTWFGLCGFLM